MNFRILIPTSNDYARTVLPITLRCLRNSGLRNPGDVIHYEVAPPEECRAEPWVRFHDHGTQRDWSRAIGEFLGSGHSSNDLTHADARRLRDMLVCRRAKNQSSAGRV